MEKIKVWSRYQWWKLYSKLGKEVIINMPQGFRVRCKPGDHLSWVVFVNRGSYEVEERSFLSSYLKPGDVFFDVGAHLGLYTLQAAHLVGPTGFVHSFEPSLDSFLMLVENVRLNGFKNVQLNPLALSDRVEIRVFFSFAKGHSHRNTFALPSDPEVSYVRTYVPCVPLDSYIQVAGVKSVHLVKIDVEGWETKVLAGGFDLFNSKEAPALIIEFFEEPARRAGSSCVLLRSTLEALGYQLFRYNSKDQELIPEPYSEGYESPVNLIAVKDRQEAEQRLKRGIQNGPRNRPEEDDHFRHFGH